MLKKTLIVLGMCLALIGLGTMLIMCFTSDWWTVAETWLRILIVMGGLLFVVVLSGLLVIWYAMREAGRTSEQVREALYREQEQYMSKPYKSH